MEKKCRLETTEGNEKNREVHVAKFRHIYGSSDQGAQGAQSEDRGTGQGKGRQDGPFQGLASTEEITMTGWFKV
jgi:hypothetical protein